MGKKNSDNYVKGLVRKYERNSEEGKMIYFDASDFGLIIDYYIDEYFYEDAEDVIEIALSIHPNNDQIKFQMARILVYTGRNEEAEEYLDSLMNDDSMEFLLLKIENLFRLIKDKEAEAIINKKLESISGDEDKADFLAQVGFLALDTDDQFAGINYLEHSLHFYESKSTYLYSELIYAYEMTGDYNSAIYYNNILLDLDPYSYENWISMGKLYSINKQYDKAIIAFDFAHTINEDDVSALKMKALTLYLNDNVEEAIRIFWDCVEKTPGDESLYDSLMEGYEYLEQYDKVSDIIDKKEKLFGERGIVIRRALLALLMDDVDLARKLYEEVPEKDRKLLDYHMLSGELYLIDKNYRESEAAFMKAALLSNNNEEVIDRLANVSVAQDKYEQAAEYLEQLIRLDPDYPTAKARLAFMRFEIGVKEPFDKVVEKFSNDELRAMLRVVAGSDDSDFSDFDRERMLVRLNEARENRVLFKNIKY